MSPWLLAVPPVLALLAYLGAVVRHAAGFAKGSTQVDRMAVVGHPRTLHLRHEDVAFQTSDGLTLRGWFLPVRPDSPCIILVHGEEHHRNTPHMHALELARDLVAHGFSVLMFDLRARGESDGPRSSAGNQELRDVLAAIDFVLGRGVALGRIGLLGFSLGAGLALLAASESPGIGAVVCDSAFKDLLDDYRGHRVGRVPVPAWLLTPLVRLIGRTLYASDLGQMRPIRIVPSLQTPLLFIHGDRDRIIPASDSQALYDASGSPEKELWLVRGAAHVRSYAVTRGLYAKRVAGFFAAHLRA